MSDYKKYINEFYSEYNSELYHVINALNLIIKNPDYSEIQSITPSVDINNGILIIHGVTKTDCINNRELLKQFVKELQTVSKSKLKFNAKIEDDVSLKKLYLTLTVSRKNK